MQQERAVWACEYEPGCTRSKIKTILAYCEIVWNSCGISNGTCLEKLQRCAAKNALNKSDGEKNYRQAEMTDSTE